MTAPLPARAAFLAGALLTALLAAPELRAAETWEVLVRQANDLRKVGDDEGAYRLFLRAYGAAPNPVTAGQLGLCEYALSRWVESESRLLEALRSRQDPWVLKNRATLLEVLDLTRKHLARVDVSGSPQGALVEVGGNPVGQLPLSGPGVTDRLDLGAAALLGKLSSGFWAGARYALADGPVRPSVSLGLPVVWINGFPQTGVQGGIGVVVPVGGHLELMADLTLAGFPAVDAGLGRVWILPSAGVQARY
jgi:hypothetical protein